MTECGRMTESDKCRYMEECHFRNSLISSYSVGVLLRTVVTAGTILVLLHRGLTRPDKT